ncbi:MAG: hypothetical protein V1685_05925 [Parcubacteria group bacterium]
MKKMNKFFPVLLAVVLLFSACGPAATAAKLYNEGQTVYVAANKAYADFVACQVFENQNIEQTMLLAYSYNWTVLQQNENYRAAKNAVTEAAAAAPTVIADDGQQVIDFNKLPKQALPDNIYSSGLAFSVYALHEAQIIPAPPEVTLKAMDSVQVSNNHKFQCAITWNNGAAAYNTWRRQVSGRVIGDLAEYFNIEDMPKELPMFSVTDFQSGAGPNTTNPYVPTP